jgi:hypothetical protein
MRASVRAIAWAMARRCAAGSPSIDARQSGIHGAIGRALPDQEAEASPRLDLRRARALQEEGQRIAHAAANAGDRCDGRGSVRHQGHHPPRTKAQRRAKVHPHGAVTSPWVPPGHGDRLAPDRDRHGVLDRDEEPALPATRAPGGPVPVRAGRSWAGPAPPGIALSGRATGISRRRRLLMTILAFGLPNCGHPFSGNKNGGARPLGKTSSPVAGVACFWRHT